MGLGKDTALIHAPYHPICVQLKCDGEQAVRCNLNFDPLDHLQISVRRPYIRAYTDISCA